MADNTELRKNISESERQAFAVMPTNMEAAFILIMNDVLHRTGWMHYPMDRPVMKSDIEAALVDVEMLARGLRKRLEPVR